MRAPRTLASITFVVGAAACGGGGRGAPSPDASSSADAAPTGVVYDAHQHIYWLADANLAGDPAVRTALGADALPINANGTMDYPTAQQWVMAMNQHAYLGHTDWQLPVMPSQDPSCAVGAGGGGNSFGPACTGSALGSLYHDLLGKTYPDSVLPGYASTIGPIANLQPSFYWSSQATPDGSSDDTFTFATDLPFKNTTKYNYFPVLAMIAGPIGTAPTGSGVIPYTSGPAAGKAIWDATTQTTWLADADLARSDAFAISGTTSINTQNGPLAPPLLDASGSMLYATAMTWVGDLDATSYAGGATWTLPAITDLQGLYTDLALVKGDARLASTASVGPFQHLQPFFYWGCMRDMSGSSASPCNGADAGTAPDGTTPMEWSFDFESGFQGTDEETKQFYVMVDYPGA
jgi:hypothetical protein